MYIVCTNLSKITHMRNAVVGAAVRLLAPGHALLHLRYYRNASVWEHRDQQRLRPQQTQQLPHFLPGTYSSLQVRPTLTLTTWLV